MTTEAFKTVAKSRLANQSTESLIAEVKKLAVDHSEGADLVSEVALDILIERMPEAEFVALCNVL